jgi:hypothetical protein
MLGETGRQEVAPIHGNGDFLAYGSPRISADAAFQRNCQNDSDTVVRHTLSPAKLCIPFSNPFLTPRFRNSEEFLSCSCKKKTIPFNILFF